MHPDHINPLFSVAGLHMSRIWHCFGNYMHEVDLPTVRKMLAASKTNVLPINTHKLNETTLRQGLLIGFGGVTYDDLAAVHPTGDMIIMLNINHQTTAGAAVEKTKLAHRLTGERVVKLEILNEDMKTSNNRALIEAVRQLKIELPQLIVFPLLANEYGAAKALAGLGCPLLRVMGSGIGEGKGILDTDEFEKICGLHVPVVLDGGVRDARDYELAHRLNAEGCLVNSALFVNRYTPDENLEAFLAASQSFLQDEAARLKSAA